MWVFDAELRPVKAINPPAYVPVQVMPSDGPSGQPEAFVLVQHTNVNIITEPRKDHIIWSLLCFVYSYPCCCFGLAALIYSIKARDLKVARDLARARRHGSTARKLNIAATVPFAILFLIFIAPGIINAAMVASVIKEMPNSNHQYNGN
ncbi:dispanin subfamily A member 2b-like [Oreochromis niloticus]|uniref:dispanin subfamily A member 2b-like n=1 Tax=Oreochromis niloticus TaxID=8128 RepID=UPI0009045E1C|nr:dispanin subfamily A member 2b-like [Oreochromis niloticus]